MKKYYQYKKKHHHLLPTTIKRIPDDDVWNDEVKKKILPKEKPRNTKGRPAAVPFRIVLDGILLFVLRTGGCQWKMLPKEYGSGSIHLSQKVVPAMGQDGRIPETMG